MSHWCRVWWSYIWCNTYVGLGGAGIWFGGADVQSSSACVGFGGAAVGFGGGGVGFGQLHAHHSRQAGVCSCPVWWRGWRRCCQHHTTCPRAWFSW